MSISKISIEKPLMMIMIILAFTMFGYVSWRALPVDRLPDITVPYITVQAIYPGAGPEEIESNVVKPIEEQVSTVAGIKSLTSYSMESVAYIILEFNDDIDPNFASIDVKDKIDQILYSLPSDLEKPIVSKMDLNDKPVVTLAVTGDMAPVAMREWVDNNLKDRFGTVSGVAKVDVTGGREREIVVALDPEKMSAHHLSIFQIAPLLDLQNVTVPGGYITGDLREYSVKTTGEFSSIEDIRNLRIAVRGKYGDYQIKLKDIAEIKDSYKDVREEARYQGKEAVLLSIKKSGDANTAETSTKIVEMFKKLKKDIPTSLDLNIIENKGVFIKNAVDDTYGNIIMGIILTAFILFGFLFDWRLTLIVGITMPVSLIMAMMGMGIMGFSLNMVTMMALTIAVGILVTNSIVVIENIVRHQGSGEDIKIAAQKGSDEIFMSVLASTLTNLAVFVPIANTSGIIGSIFKSLGLTIVFATIASLFLSFTLVPLLASRLLKTKKKVDHEDAHMVDKMLRRVDQIYVKYLEKLLSNRFAQIVIILGTVVMLFSTMIFIAPKLGSEFMTTVDEGYIDIAVELPAGTPISVSRKVMKNIEDRIKDTPTLVAYSSSIGGAGSKIGAQYGLVKIELQNESEREQSIGDIIKLIRPKLADIPDAKISVKATESDSKGDADIELEIRGPNLDSILAISKDVMSIMKADKGLTDLNSSWKGRKPEIKIIPNRDRMEHYGLSSNLQQSATIKMIGGMVRYNINGNDDAIYRENGEEYPIRVQLDKSSRENIRDIETMEVMTTKGPIPLEAIAKVEYSGGVSKLSRKNREKMVGLSANILVGSAGAKVASLSKAISDNIKLPSGYSYKFVGDQEMMEESNGQLATAGLIAIILTLMVLIALLESVTMGLVIFATIPMGVIGVIWGLYLTNNTLSMISLLSVIMLIGIVVNNAILLIDYAREQRKKQGLSAKEAIVLAGEMKLKPIIMSNLAIIVSMIPMALAMGAGGSFRAPFAITAIAGVMVSTALTFFGIPILYVWTAPKSFAKTSEA